MADEKCPLCGRAPRSLDEDPHTRTARVDCQTCGTYLITHKAKREVNEPEFELKRPLLSAVTRERSVQRSPITLCSSGYQANEGSEPVGVGLDEIINSLFPRSIPERIDRALQNLERLSRNPGTVVTIDDARDRPLLFAESDDALRFMLKHMLQSNLLDQVSPSSQGGQYALAVKGWERIEELRHLRPESRQAFVAMWFDPQLDEAWKGGFQPAIKGANYHAMRIDKKDFVGKIDDEIVAEIRRSRFVVADVTGHRPAVYFEAGFAMALGLPVIFTCHKDHLKDCSFDTRQYPHIVWETAEDLKTQLKNRIDAAIVREAK